jgi:hypothetical protein
MQGVGPQGKPRVLQAACLSRRVAGRGGGLGCGRVVLRAWIGGLKQGASGAHGIDRGLGNCRARFGPCIRTRISPRDVDRAGEEGLCGGFSNAVR